MLPILIFVGLGLAAAAAASRSSVNAPGEAAPGGYHPDTLDSERAELEAHAASRPAPDRPILLREWNLGVSEALARPQTARARERIARGVSSYRHEGLGQLADGLARRAERGPLRDRAASAPAPVAANCGTLEQLEASPLGIFNRASVIAWAQCPERTAQEIEQLAARIDHEFQQAATDERALYYAQTRDQARAAFMRTHPSAPPPSSQR